MSVPTRPTWRNIPEDGILRVFDKFPKFHMKILLQDFEAKVSRKTFLNQHLGIIVCTK
jgi:hypothetical protein